MVNPRSLGRGRLVVLVYFVKSPMFLFWLLLGLFHNVPLCPVWNRFPLTRLFLKTWTVKNPDWPDRRKITETEWSEFVFHCSLLFLCLSSFKGSCSKCSPSRLVSSIDLLTTFQHYLLVYHKNIFHLTYCLISKVD